MDTATHAAVGVGLAGLSHIDPVVAADPKLAVAVFIGTAAGSQAPDLDTLLRLKSNALYIRHHRGISHSIPAMILWTILISGAAAAITGTEHIGHLLLWTFIAVCIHVWQDLFNAYGTQVLAPFYRRWIAWNIIHIFDPFIFTAHLVTILLWILHVQPPQILFPCLYIIIACYYIWRTAARTCLKHKLLRSDPDLKPQDRYDLFPTYKIGVWNVVKTRAGEASFRIGEWKKRRFQWVDELRCQRHPAIEASKELEDVQALLSLTDFACPECFEHDWGYEVRWTDIRYLHRKQYPFVAIALLDHELQPLNSYVGWLSNEKLEKKLRLKPQERWLKPKMPDH